MKDFIKKIWQKTIVRFVVVGFFNTVLDTSILLFGYKVIGLNEIVANTISVSIAVTTSYFLNHRVVFKYDKKYSLKNFIRFFAVTGVSVIIIQNIVIYVVTKVLWQVSQSRTVDLFGHTLSLRTVELLLAKIAAVLIGMVWNFILYKYLVFKHISVSKDEEFVAS